MITHLPRMIVILLGINTCLSVDIRIVVRDPNFVKPLHAPSIPLRRHCLIAAKDNRSQ